MIRIYKHGDHAAIAEIFCAAVHQIASRDYSQEQCLAWSSRAPNYSHWKKRCELKRPFVAADEDSGSITGFLELDPDGHIDCAYINPAYQRRGIMTRLVGHAIRTGFDAGLARLYVEASITAKPMFTKIGFHTVEEKQVRIGDVTLKNYIMEHAR